MSLETPGTFSCTDCGKKYTAKPELLGKKVRCTCGAVMSVPEATAIPTAAPAEDDGLYDFANDPAPLPKNKPPTVALVAAPALPISIPGLKDDDYLCPDCGKRMDPGAVICSHCGFNIKTGEKLIIGRPKQPMTNIGSKFGVIPTRKTPTIVDDKKAQLMRMLIPASLIIVVVLAIIGYKLIVKYSGASAEANPQNKDDAQVAVLTEDSGAKEIHAWFKENPQRIAGGLSPSQAIAKADGWQKLGAKQVLAFGGVMTRVLAIELPDDPQQRKALFEDRFARTHHDPPPKDEGQKYLLVNLGL